MKISKEKREKISEQILATLFLNSPRPLFTFHIAREVARDEEFIKDLLEDLKKKGLVVKVNKNPQGVSYKRRIRWKMTNEAYTAYKHHTS
jgi:predicted transcriptional regulator